MTKAKDKRAVTLLMPLTLYRLTERDARANGRKTGPHIVYLIQQYYLARAVGQ
jgi:hypothetical protein